MQLLPNGHNSIAGNAGGPYKTLKGALNVHAADVHNIPINNFFFRTTATNTTLSAAASSGDIDINVVDASGFAVGNEIQVNGADQTTFPVIIGITVNNIQLDRPLDNDHIIGTSITLVHTEMTESGTVAAPVSHIIGPPAGVIWHITRVLISMTHGSAGDLGLFGNLAALTNGVVFRANVSGQLGTFSNWKSNADIKNDMFDVEFDTRSGGGGTFGTSGRGSFSRIGTVVRLDGDLGDHLEMLVQDNLTTLTTFRIKAQGHVEGA